MFWTIVYPFSFSSSISEYLFDDLSLLLNIKSSIDSRSSFVFFFFFFSNFNAEVISDTNL